MLDEIKQKAEEVYSKAKDVGEKAKNVVSNLTGSRAVKKIGEDISGQIRKGNPPMNYFHEDDK